MYPLTSHLKIIYELFSKNDISFKRVILFISFQIIYVVTRNIL